MGIGGSKSRALARRAARTHPGDDAFVCGVCPGVGPKDLKLLRRTFVRVDADASGVIDPLEFLMHFDLERTAFSLKVMKDGVRPPACQ